METKPKWTTKFESSREEEFLEYSVVREGTHGQRSLGWGDGIDKFILFSNDFFEQSKATKATARAICREFAKSLNKRGF